VDTSWTLLAWQAVAALTTLAIFSFLLGDNPVYKFVERLWVGVTTGYWTMLLYHTNFYDKVYSPDWLPFQITREHRLIYLIPTLLGLLMWFRLSPRLSWLSRYALAFYIGISTGIFIPLELKRGVFLQVEAAIRPLDLSWAGLNGLLVLIGVLCSLSYFFFSKEHTGLFGGVSRAGIYTLMIGFGAGFGLTVMGRVALLVQRVIFLRDFATRLWEKLF
jgi:hypothetical protein